MYPPFVALRRRRRAVTHAEHSSAVADRNWSSTHAPHTIARATAANNGPAGLRLYHRRRHRTVSSARTVLRPPFAAVDVTSSSTTSTMSPGGLLLKKSCGETVCDAYYMCSGHDFRCYPCHGFCDNTSNNYDASICEQQCQDYIHDYVKHYAKDENIQEALQALQNLKALVIFMTVLVAIALIFISATLMFIWKRERRIRKIKNGGQDSFFKKKLASLQYLKNKDQQQQSTAVNTVSETVANQTATTCTSLAATQTDLTAATCTTDGTTASSSSSSSSASSSGQRTNTSSAGGVSNTSGSSNSNKLPCEDATLEFSGYDNFALKVSPVLPGKTTTPMLHLQPTMHQMQFTP